MLRRLLSLLVLTAVFAYGAESVLGALREGKVHHETGAVAALHGAQSPGDHGHEDGGTHHHGAGHEHGTSSDHCTHQHGTDAPLEALALHTPRISSAVPPLTRTLPAPGAFAAPFHPPRV